MIDEFIRATLETLYMTFLSGAIAIFFGLPLGILLFFLSKSKKNINKKIYYFVDFFVNVFRSIPFIILIILLIPLTKLIIGTIIGPNSAIVALSIAAIPFMGRLAENSFNNLSKGLLDTATVLGMNKKQFIFKILIPESFADITSGITLLLINLITFTAIAGAVGAGGLGAMAINYGYQRFRWDILIIDVLILIVITQLIQFFGNRLSKSLRK
ncbi:MAG: ABC transporter permease subunit [Thermotogota bacterium]